MSSCKQRLMAREKRKAQVPPSGSGAAGGRNKARQVLFALSVCVLFQHL